MLTEQDFEDTLHMLDAANGTALIKPLSEIVPRIWEEAKFYKKGTDWVMQHPVMLLWVGKMANLSWGEEPPYEKWVLAYNYVMAKVDGLTIGENITPIWLPEQGYTKVD